MKYRRATIVLAAALLAAAAPKDLLDSARAQIQATDNALSPLKDGIQWAMSLTVQGLDMAQTTADEWERRAAGESDEKIKNARLGFRDCQRSLAHELTGVKKLLKDEDGLADRMESDQKSSASLQRQLEQLVEKSDGTTLTPAELQQVSDGLSRFEKSLDESAKSLTSLKGTVGNRTSAVTEDQTRLRALLAEAGDPPHRLERWEKELVKLGLDDNDVVRRLLGLLGLHCEHISVVLDKMNATLRIQRDILKNLQ